jgi:hypothetical protein
MTAGSIPVSRATSTRKVCISDRAFFQASPVITRISSASSASVGSVGDSFDNARAETISGLYKTELIKHRGPWRTVEQVEYGTGEWVDWFNQRRQQNWRTPTTVKPSPANRSGAQKHSDRTRRCDSDVDIALTDWRWFARTPDKPGKPQDYAGLRVELADLVDKFLPGIDELWPRLEDHKYRWELYCYGLPDGYDKLVASDIRMCGRAATLRRRQPPPRRQDHANQSGRRRGGGAPCCSLWAWDCV